MGYTYTLDEISWAPPDGWVLSTDGLELVEGHTYVIWTWDGFYAKLRVTNLDDDDEYVDFDWAYQVDHDNPELMRPRWVGDTRVAPGGAPLPPSRDGA